jgi:hypothetical protein
MAISLYPIIAADYYGKSGPCFLPYELSARPTSQFIVQGRFSQTTIQRSRLCIPRSGP